MLPRNTCKEFLSHSRQIFLISQQRPFPEPVKTAAAKFSAYVTGPQIVTILLIRTVTQVAQPFAQCIIATTPQSIAVIGTIQQYFRIVIDSFFYFSQIPLLFSADSITRSIKRLSPFFYCWRYIPQTAAV